MNGVLAVMERVAIYVAVEGSDEEHAEFTEARAAVAELVEAAKNLRATGPNYSIAYGQAEQRLDAALARVQGEGA